MYPSFKKRLNCLVALIFQSARDRIDILRLLSSLNVNTQDQSSKRYGRDLQIILQDLGKVSLQLTASKVL